MAVLKVHPNVAAFLDMLAFSEETATHPLTRNQGYDVVVTGIDGKPEIFTDYSDHPFEHGRPAKKFNRRGGALDCLRAVSAALSLLFFHGKYIGNHYLKRNNN